MAFSENEIEQLATMLAASDGGPKVVAEYRAAFPGKTLTRCDSSDMSGDAEPYRSIGLVDLYFVDGRDHCWHITADPTHATGVVLARRRAAK